MQAVNRNSIEQTFRSIRLQTLGGLGLSAEVRKGVWTLALQLEQTLRLIGDRSDIKLTGIGRSKIYELLASGELENKDADLHPHAPAVEHGDRAHSSQGGYAAI